MCGDGGRESQGGAIAILNPVNTSLRSSNPRSQAELRFIVGENQSHTDRLIYHGANGRRRDGFFVVIHEQGDLTTSPEEAGCFHKFKFEADASGSGSMTEMRLSQPLEISPGIGGVIGRRISIFDDASMRRRSAEGIIGWN
ncbi:hypothetical protein EJ08DRAFT_737685 [Tothia fuscella]|uniref:Uncharacterized protein n=1 Tax=Tothia fuscella TaxID=1048955 RepID=A0A9P4TUV9_9PEZI|nr:hypothetical protein EJ08DRAFT_737685 [Tothia fuscella]